MTKSDRWMIKLTKENIDVVGKYYNEHCQNGTTCYTTGEYIGRLLSSHDRVRNLSIIDGRGLSPGFIVYNVLKEEPEITTEQFCQLAGIGEPVENHPLLNY